MQLVVIAHNIRSTHNIGSIFRTCDGFGVSRLYLTGYTPHPSLPNDPRMPYVHEKLTRQIHKTALGAETTVPFRHCDKLIPLLSRLKKQGFYICALEQHFSSVFVDEFWSFFSGQPPDKIALILGNELTGLSEALSDSADMTLEIRMLGKKESFNVSVAAGIALYALSRRP